MARQRKPLELHLVEGTFNATKHKDREGQELKLDIPEDVKKPPFVKYRAARIWKRYAPDLIRNGLLAESDAHMFALWCCLAAEMEESPANFNASRIAQFRAIGAQFGMSPTDRLRLGGLKPKGNEPAKPKDEAFFG